jgi:hypothetical protein
MKFTVLMLVANVVSGPCARAQSVVSAAEREMLRGIPDR